MLPGVVSRQAGWWGIAFAVLLLLGGGMASVPTGDDSSAKIVAFYDAHASVVIVAQLVGLLAVIALALFTVGLARNAPDETTRRNLIVALVITVIAELATNVPPLVLASTSRTTASAAHAWTVAADITDVALFLALGLLAALLAVREIAWLRWLGLLAAALCWLRAVASPMGFRTLDAIAPFVALGFFAATSLWIVARKRLWALPSAASGATH
jgi:hypothetical protein